MRITTDGIVIGTGNFDESDRLVTLLSGEYGVLRAYARGARRTGGRLCGSTELLSYSRFVLFLYRDRCTVNDADVNTLFWGVRQDVEKLALASYLCELSAETSPAGDAVATTGGAQAQLRLLLNCLSMLDAGKRPAAFLKPVFELRQIGLAGYQPDLVGCRVCGAFECPEGFHFYPLSGELRCASCDGDGAGDQYDFVSPGVVAAMRHILYSRLEKLFSFALPEDALRTLGAVCERYVQTQLSRTFRTLDFYHAMEA